MTRARTKALFRRASKNVARNGERGNGELSCEGEREIRTREKYFPDQIFARDCADRRYAERLALIGKCRVSSRVTCGGLTEFFTINREKVSDRVRQLGERLKRA